MKLLTKRSWMKIHTYVSLFFLPFALLYAITGIGYICGFNQDAFAQVYEIPLESTPQKGEEKELILRLLAQHHFATPPSTELRFHKGNPVLGNLAYSASISKDKEGTPILRVVHRSAYGVLLLMHKSSGTKFEFLSLKLTAFDMLAIGFGASLLLLYLSGLMVSAFCKGARISSFSTLAAGVLICAIAVYMSV